MADPDPKAAAAATTAGNYFVANYPPFSAWSEAGIPAAQAALARPPQAGTPLGLYVHLPFCRKRCDFCYFKVYTDKNGREVRRYLDAVLAELDRYLDQAFLAGRTPDFIYFGGGTPSYLSSEQLTTLFEGLKSRLSWEKSVEVAFECEPGTLQQHKVELLKQLGVTRLSLGVENFNAEILELNNRAHRTDEIYRAYQWARDAGFDQINIDLIAGMVGETEANWSHCVEKTLELSPECVTIYQMEVPYNTTIYRRMKDGGEEVAPVADWETKRRWADEAFAALEKDGYELGSAYTACKPSAAGFLYRDALWRGADLLGLGVSSFSHIGGVHFQNEHAYEPYVARVEAGELPITRALALNAEERLIREFVLQMKLGRIEARYFQDKFGVDVREHFASALGRHEADGYLRVTEAGVEVTRSGLFEIDRLLWDFFEEPHRNARYA